MTKVVVNRCYGGFSVSLEAARRMAELGHDAMREAVEAYDAKAADPSKQSDSERRYGLRFYGQLDGDAERSNPILVRVVEELGDRADGEVAALDIVEIPDDVDFVIEDYDGREWVAEKRRTW